MTVKELIQKVNDAAKLSRDYNYAKHIKHKYMPYTQKCALVKSIIESTSYEEVSGIKLYKRNTNAMLFVFTMKLIEYYTDIEIDLAAVATEYDALMESEAMNGLMSQIPAEEISIIRGMIDMERDDLEINTRSLVSFLETKADAIGLAIETINKTLQEPAVQKKIAEFTK